MATVIETGLVSFFSPLLVFLFVYAIVFAILEKTKLLGDKMSINAVVAFVFGLMFIMVRQAREVLTTSIPWILLIFALLVLIFMIFMFAGVSEEEMVKPFLASGPMAWVIGIAIALIFVVALGQVFGDQVRSIYIGGAGANVTEAATAVTSSGSLGLAQEIGKIIFHPNILALILILVISALAVKFISQQTRPSQ